MIKKIKKQLTDAKFMKFGAYELMTCFRSRDWKEAKEFLENHEIKDTKEILDYIKTSMNALEVDLCELSIPNKYIVSHIESAGKTQKLLEYLPKRIINKYKMTEYPWFTFLPVDYNIGSEEEYMIIALSKDKAALEFVEGNY
jgi:hypothetical protein